MQKSYKFQFSQNGEKSFLKLPKNLQKRVLKKLKFFEDSKKPLDFAKKLIGFNNRFRFRIGEYRIIVSKKDKNTIVILVILKIAHRKNAYD